MLDHQTWSAGHGDMCLNRKACHQSNMLPSTDCFPNVVMDLAPAQQVHGVPQLPKCESHYLISDACWKLSLPPSPTQLHLCLCVLPPSLPMSVISLNHRHDPPTCLRATNGCTPCTPPKTIPLHPPGPIHFQLAPSILPTFSSPMSCLHDKHTTLCLLTQAPSQNLLQMSWPTFSLRLRLSLRHFKFTWFSLPAIGTLPCDSFSYSCSGSVVSLCRTVPPCQVSTLPHF